MYNILGRIPTLGALAFKSFIEASEGDYEIDFTKLPKGSTFWYIVNFKMNRETNISMILLAMTDFLITSSMLNEMTLGQLTSYVKKLYTADDSIKQWAFMKELAKGKEDILAMHPLRKYYYDNDTFLDKEGLNERGRKPVLKDLTKLIIKESKQATASPSRFTIDEISLLINDKVDIESIIQKLSRDPYIREKAVYYTVKDIIIEHCQEKFSTSVLENLQFNKLDTEITNGYANIYKRMKSLLYKMYELNNHEKIHELNQQEVDCKNYEDSKQKKEDEAINSLLLSAFKENLPISDSINLKKAEESKSHEKNISQPLYTQPYGLDKFMNTDASKKENVQIKSEIKEDTSTDSSESIQGKHIEMKSQGSDVTESVHIKRLSDSAVFPSKTFSNASTYEIYASKNCTISPNTFQQLNTDVIITPPKKYIGIIMQRPESQVHYGFSTTLTTIDWLANKELIITAFNHSKTEITIKKGQPIARMVLTERIDLATSTSFYKPINNPKPIKSDFTYLQKQTREFL